METPAHETATEAEEPESTEEPVVEIKRIDLTDAMSDVNVMRELLPATQGTEAGMHDSWYQAADGSCGYGTFDGNDLVDDFFINTPDYEVYGIYVGEDITEARAYLKNSAWTQDANDKNAFVKNKENLSLRDDDGDGLIEQISMYRSRPAPWEKEEAVAEDDDYFFPNSLDELLSESQLAGMSARELTLARNEVYARYGYTFQRQDLQEYFNTKSWYKAKPEVNKDTIGNYVSAIGMKNMVMIREYQKAHGLTY